MFRASINLGRVNSSMVVKFNIVLRDDSTNKQSYQSLVNKFNMGGNDYLVFNPHPYITIDISSKKKDEAWNPNNSISMTRPFALNLCKLLRKCISDMKTANLFFYRDHHLIMNRSVAQGCIGKCMIKNKYVGISPTVVIDGDVEYEGLMFMINSPANFCNLTIQEAEYLLDILVNTDMTSLSMTLINSASIFKNVDSQKIERQFTESSENPAEEITDKRIKPPNDNPVPDLT